MTEITVYKCDYCDKKSIVYKNLLKHEEECKEKYEKDMAYKAMKEVIVKEFLESFDPERLGEQINGYLKKANGDHFKSIHWNLNYSPNVSNSHNCPIDGVINFNRSHEKPKGYPGFVGNIEGSISKNGETLSEYTGGWHHRGMYIPGLHTGTGGRGTKTWQYHILFFIQDFPTLHEILERKRIKNNLLDLPAENIYYAGKYESSE